jgi:acylphosphatase
MEPRRFQQGIQAARRSLQVQTFRLLISGRVQGVGFRDALQQEAERLNLRGWVRNLRTGEVEALLQGPAQAVAALQDWARRGPPAARVERVECGAPSPEHARDYARFERWPSA